MQFLGDAYVRGFSNEELDKMAEMALNGRQIKNVLRTTHLLARKQEAKLAYSHAQTILILKGSGSVSAEDN